jgi:hypothetical protein
VGRVLSLLAEHAFKFDVFQQDCNADYGAGLASRGVQLGRLASTAHLDVDSGPQALAASSSTAVSLSIQRNS